MPPHPLAQASATPAAAPPDARRRWRTAAHGLTAAIALAAAALALHLGTTGPAASPGGATPHGSVADGARR